MNTDQEALDCMFRRSGWSPWTVTESHERDSFDIVFGCEYAGVLVCLRDSVDDVVDQWPNLQQVLRAAAPDDFRGELYLMFIVPVVESRNEEGLRKMLNDTHVSRKLCLERRKRPIAEVMQDAPSLLAFGTPNEGNTHMPDAGISAGLRADILQDLATRQPIAIADKLVGNEYEQEDTQDAT